MFLKRIEQGQINQITKEKVPFTNDTIENGVVFLSGSSINFTLIDRTIPSEKNNLFSSFNLPYTEDQKEAFITGRYANSQFSGLSQNKYVVMEIPTNSYGELIDGKTLKVSIPQYSGSTEVVVDLYATYENTGLERNYYNGLFSEASLNAEFFGQPRIDFNGKLINPPADSNEPYESNIAFLFADDIRKPLGEPGNTWSLNYSNIAARPYTISNGLTTDVKPLFNFRNDKPVGIAYLDKGFVVISDPTLVDRFYNPATPAQTIGSGFTGLTKTTYSASTVNTQFFSYNNEYALNLVCIAGANEFYSTQNPTAAALEGKSDGDVVSFLDTETPVLITEVGLYDDNNTLLAIAKPDRPISKYWYETVAFVIKLKI